MFKLHRQKSSQRLHAQGSQARYHRVLERVLAAVLVCSSGLLTIEAQAVESLNTGPNTKADSTHKAQLEQINQQFAAAVVIPTYQTLSKQADRLMLAGAAFEQLPTAANLSALQDAWLATELTWARSNAFEFGPVHSLGYGPAIASPVDTTGIDQLLAQLAAVEANTEASAEENSTEEGSEESIAIANYLDEASIHPSLKGLGAIAHILNRNNAASADAAATEDGSRPASDFSSNFFSNFSTAERVYLSYLAAEIQVAAVALLEVWQTGWNNYPAYATVLANAGSPDNAIYLSTRSGTEEIIRGMLNSLDVVVNEALPELIAAPDQLMSNSLDLQVLNSTLEGIQLASQSAGLAALTQPAGGDQSQQIQQSLETATVLLDAAQDQPQEPAVIAFALTVALDSLQTAHALLDNDVLPLTQE